LSGLRFIASRRAAAFISLRKRDRSLVTAFPSPTKASACADSVPGSKFLACYFAHLPAGLPARSAFRLRRQLLVCPSVRLHPRLMPVAVSTCLLCRLCRLPSLPFRSFRSLGIKRAGKLRNRSVRLPESPDLRSLPAAFPLKDSATDQRSRSATFPEACCSRVCKPDSVPNEAGISAGDAGRRSFL